MTRARASSGTRGRNVALLGALLLSLAWGTARSGGRAWYFSNTLPGPIEIPSWLSADSLRDALDYEPDEEVAGIVVDLNRDGARDYLFRYSLAVCGSNCQYDVVDGRLRRKIGLVGGSVIHVDSLFINGQPVFHTYGHGSADSGYWGTYVFDGDTYVSVGGIYVERESQKHLFDMLKGVSYGPPGD